MLLTFTCFYGNGKKANSFTNKFQGNKKLLGLLIVGITTSKSGFHTNENPIQARKLT